VAGGAGRIVVVGGTAGRALPGLPSVGVIDWPYADAVARIAAPAIKASVVFLISCFLFLAPDQCRSNEKVAAKIAILGGLIGTLDRNDVTASAFSESADLTPTPSGPIGPRPEPPSAKAGALFLSIGNLCAVLCSKSQVRRNATVALGVSRAFPI
jgi:hypothetical protein